MRFILLKTWVCALHEGATARRSRLRSRLEPHCRLHGAAAVIRRKQRTRSAPSSGAAAPRAHARDDRRDPRAVPLGALRHELRGGGGASRPRRPRDRPTTTALLLFVRLRARLLRAPRRANQRAANEPPTTTDCGVENRTDQMWFALPAPRSLARRRANAEPRTPRSSLPSSRARARSLSLARSKRNFPELTWEYGYPLWWFTVIVSVSGVLLWFRQNTTR